MKAENTLQFMMDFYGEIFYNRQKCLNHLFCTIGNGYEWQNGQLVSLDHDERMDRWYLHEDIKHAEPCRMVKEIGDIYESVYAARAKVTGRPVNKWYPISKECSYICNYPDDIQPDWLKLINECKQMLMADGIEVPENNR